MKKVAYIIPGWGEDTNQKEYKKIAEFFKSKNFKIKSIKIKWKYKTMSDYVEDFLSQFDKSEEEVYILGFSFGAMIALISAEKINPSKIILCSLSPYFKEDLSSLKKSWINLNGRRRMENYKKLSFNEIAKKINCKTILLMGEKEGIQVENRVKEAKKKIKNSKLIKVKNTKHDISQKEYLNEIKKIVGEL